jgi:hypothetical protein
MNSDYKNLLPADFDPNSRVWIYQSNRPFSLSESLNIKKQLEEFGLTWKSHGKQVKGFGKLLFSQFIILMADETATGVSGCSTDSSVRFVKEIEQLYEVSMFERQILAFLINDKVELIPLGQLQQAIDSQFINANTIYFNNLVQTKTELENNWMIPLSASWLSKKIRVSEQSS